MIGSFSLFLWLFLACHPQLTAGSTWEYSVSGGPDIQAVSVEVFRVRSAEAVEVRVRSREGMHVVVATRTPRGFRVRIDDSTYEDDVELFPDAVGRPWWNDWKLTKRSQQGDRTHLEFAGHDQTLTVEFRPRLGLSTGTMYGRTYAVQSVNVK